MARTVWDDDDAAPDEAPTNVAKPPPLPPSLPKASNLQKASDLPKATNLPKVSNLPKASDAPRAGDLPAAGHAPKGGGGDEPAWIHGAGSGDGDGGGELGDEPPDPPKRGWARSGWLLAGLATAGLAASVSRNLDERARFKVAVSLARDEAAENRRSLFVAEDKLATAERDRAAKAGAVSQLSEQVKAHDVEREQTDRLIAELKSKVDAKDGEVSSQSNQIMVNLVDEILFKSGDAELSPRGKQVLARVGGVLKGLTDKQILIGGHTDSRPIHTEQFPSNWELSSARAVNVVRYLQDVAGVDPARLTAAGYSQFHPRGRSLAKNRRIEILLTPIVTVKKG